jgi:hypothetical protein
MRDLGLTLILAGLIIAAAAAVHHVTRVKGQHAAPHGDGLNAPGEEDVFVAELRGDEPWEPAPKPAHPADTMVPLYGADDAPSPRPRPLPPLNVPGPDSSADRAPGYPAKLGGGQEFDSPSGPGTLFAEAADEIDALIDDVKRRFGIGEATPPAAETVDEKWERLFPRAVPAWAAEHVNFHEDNADMVESMFTRAQAAQVRTMASGQVDHD